MDKDYELIPMSDIDDEAREISVRWMECEDKDWIGQKHKLASDIMNYAKKHWKDYLPSDKEVDAFIKSHPGNLGNVLLNKSVDAGFKTAIIWLRDKK